jgi:DNA polymerase III sliding clamp (beta) subunit (PCNA family)
MKFKVNIGEFTEALAQASVTTDRLTSMPIGNVYVRAAKKDEKGYLYLYSTNLDSETVIKLEADVEEEGDTQFDPSQVLGGLVGRPKDDKIEVSLPTEDKNRVKVQYGKSRFHLSAAVDEHKILAGYLKKVPFQDKPSFTVKGSDLAEFVRRGSFCIPSKDTGNSLLLGGMYFSDAETGYDAHATDGVIATRITVVAEKGKLGKFMIPLKSLPAVARLLGKKKDEDIQLIFAPSTDKLYFKAGDMIFGTRLLPSNLDSVRKTVESTKSTHVFNVSRQQLRSALERTSNFAGNDSRMLRMEIKKEAVELKMAHSLSENHDVVEIEHRGEFPGNIKIAVNMDYLLNITSSSSGDKLEIGITGPVNPLVVCDESDKKVQSKYVLMPMRA